MGKGLCNKRLDRVPTLDTRSTAEWETVNQTVNLIVHMVGVDNIKRFCSFNIYLYISSGAALFLVWEKANLTGRDITESEFFYRNRFGCISSFRTNKSINIQREPIVVPVLYL